MWCGKNVVDFANFSGALAFGVVFAGNDSTFMYVLAKHLSVLI